MWGEPEKSRAERTRSWQNPETVNSSWRWIAQCERQKVVFLLKHWFGNGWTRWQQSHLAIVWFCKLMEWGSIENHTKYPFFLEIVSLSFSLLIDHNENGHFDRKNNSPKVSTEIYNKSRMISVEETEKHVKVILTKKCQCSFTGGSTKLLKNRTL